MYGLKIVFALSKPSFLSPQTPSESLGFLNEVDILPDFRTSPTRCDRRFRPSLATRFDMSTTRTITDVKTALAEKYERLARLTSSTTRKMKLSNRAKIYRRQITQLGRAK